MKILFILLIHISTHLMAEDLVVNRNAFMSLSRLFMGDSEYALSHQNTHLFLIGSNHSEKRKIVNEFEIWAEVSIDESRIDYSKDLDISNLVNYGLKSRNFKVGDLQLTHALNCHGTTLAYSRYLDVKRYVGSAEMLFFLENYCEEVKVPQVGTIAVTFAYQQPFHSLTFMTPYLTFEKRSVQKDESFRFGYKLSLDSSYKYFNCVVNRPVCREANLDNFSAKVNEIELKIGRMLGNGENVNLRKQWFYDVQTLMAAKPNLHSHECKFLYQELYVKLQSLNDLLRSIQGMGFYRPKDSLIFRESPL